MNFLNSGRGYELFEIEALKDSYVDKSMLIDTVFQYAHRTNRYICVTRPRRFGKSTAANMIAAFFDKGSADESGILFKGLEVGKLFGSGKAADKTSLWAHQGNLDVIRINMIDLITEKTKSHSSITMMRTVWRVLSLLAIFQRWTVTISDVRTRRGRAMWISCLNL